MKGLLAVLLFLHKDPVLAEDSDKTPYADYLSQHDLKWGSTNLTGYGILADTGCFPTVAAI